jgi:hypothetical protein
MDGFAPSAVESLRGKTCSYSQFIIRTGTIKITPEMGRIGKTYAFIAMTMNTAVES